MGKEIASLKPAEVWRIFGDLCATPRPSKHEEKVRAFIVDFAKKNGIDHSVDEAGNVILRKAATPGMENRKGIILQAHMDMVPQKNGDKTFDFLTDPIQPYVDGNWVTADGTTLGADNGIGLAAAMAVMVQKDLAHGPLEVLVTTDEETGMTGAFGLKAGELKGDILLNLDSEDEGELYVGCAGGSDLIATLPYRKEDAPEGSMFLRLDLTGLRGGHSGLEINLQRANSNKVMFRLLKRLTELFDVRLSSVSGGDMRNAIPREAHAVIAFDPDLEPLIRDDIDETWEAISSEFAEVDPDMTLEVTQGGRMEKVIDLHAQERLINAVNGMANGVDRMSDSIPGLVETSSNVGIVAMEAKHFQVVSLVRSSVDSAKEDLLARIASVFELAGAEIEISGTYGGWKPNLDSPILGEMKEIYQRMFGKVPEVKAIHAGLECGILGATEPKLDMISFGPTIRYPHSPDEKVNIESVVRFWQLLLATIENAPVK